MGTAATFTRRAFLLGSAAIAGGVAFGAYLYNTRPPNPLARGLPKGAAAFNPWVKVDANGITLIAPHTDLGQGVRSLQAMLIAEEMDLDPGQFSVETGPPDPNYFNGAIVTGLLGLDRQDRSFKARASIGAIDTVARSLDLQVTGGSSTASDSYLKLREAGAMARETLKLAAARLTGVAVSELNTRSGSVVLPDGSTKPYTELAAVAAEIEPVSAVTLRDPAQWKHLGKPMTRLDVVGKSTGTLDYGIDLRVDKMLYAAIRLCPALGGRLVSHDADAARKLPGVREIFEIEGGLAVVADRTWNALHAATSIECEWSKGEGLADMDCQWQAVVDAFANAPHAEPRNDGDVEAALASGATVQGEYRVPYLAHQPLEPLGALVHVTDTRVDMWVSSQMPIVARRNVSQVTGLPEADIHLHNQYCGGSFGLRLECDHIRVAAEIGKRMKGTPVKLVYSREEDFTHDFPRPLSASRFAAKSVGGRIEAFDIAVSGPSVMASQGGRAGFPAPGPDSELHAGISNAPYAIPAMRIRTHEVDGLAPTSSWRSVGASGNGFFLESALDEAILASGGDPLAERLRLCNSPHAKAVLEAVAEMSGWGTPMPAGHGRGIAMVESFGTPVAEVVEVSVSDDGIRIDKVFVAANVGPVLDPVNIDNQIKGGVVWGLGHAMNCEITYRDGRVEQTNYHAFEGMRMHQCPEIHVRLVDTGKRITGIGEPPVPPAAPALANAIFAATGQRLREMPFNKTVTFV